MRSVVRRVVGERGNDPAVGIVGHMNQRRTPRSSHGAARCPQSTAIHPGEQPTWRIPCREIGGIGAVWLLLCVDGTLSGCDVLIREQ